jgi:hypothetical protein
MIELLNVKKNKNYSNIKISNTINNLKFVLLYINIALHVLILSIFI